MEVLELYSGIGGMHLALIESGAKGKVVGAVEINTTANEIYKHNFPNTKICNANLEGFSANDINKFHPNTILMSPPCQPFTRNGLQQDIKDPRTASFLHLLKLLPETNIKNILVENVKGFETSEMRDILIETLVNNKFTFQEFIISPHQIGIPNTRHRYYCLAKKLPHKFSFELSGLVHHFPGYREEHECFNLSEILEDYVDESVFLTPKILQKYANILDICHMNSTRSCCFTKTYGRFIEGTGSVFTKRTENEVSQVFLKCDNVDIGEKLELLKSLNLRFFTPREVCRLMCFPESFTFPANISDRKKYTVLGNSLNVKVVAELIKILSS